MRLSIIESRLFGRICYGFERDNHGIVSVNEYQSAVVHKIFEMYFSDMSLEVIQKYLHSEHILSPSGKEVWSRDVIHKILRNEKYTRGIVSPEVFISVQYMLENNCRNTVA